MTPPLLEPVVTVAVAQYGSVPADVDANVAKHVRAVRTAAAAGARVALFPELSLTGYELTRIADEPGLTLTLDDARLQPIRAATADLGITALVGAPLQDGADRVLAALAISPEGTIQAYAKRNLFEQERDVFTPGTSPLVLDVDGVRLALGVCADLADDRQVSELSELDADAWLLGVLVSTAGYEVDAARAARAARRTGTTVVLANHAAPTGGWTPAGRSGAWEPTGDGRHLGKEGTQPEEEQLIIRLGRRAR